MSTIIYWELPAIPEHLIESPEMLVNTLSPHPHIRHTSPELKSWIQDVFVKPVVAFYFVFGKNFNNQLGVAPHKDRFSRKYAFNYVLTAGGNNVITTVYDDTLNITDQKIITEKTWHRLPTNNWHSVHGVNPNKYRIVLTVHFLEDAVSKEPVIWLGDRDYTYQWDYNTFMSDRVSLT